MKMCKDEKESEMNDQERQQQETSNDKKDEPKQAVPKERGRTFGRTGSERQK